jgi:hypothetical protein
MAVSAAILLAVAAPASGQDPVDVGLGAPVPERPGLFRLGSLYLTPYLRIGTLGIDTNVFYTATDRQTDFIASGGPGLEVVWPLGRQSRLRLDGGLNYLYFARTESQRRLTGYGSALLQLEGVKTRFLIEERYDETFSRPSFEVDARVRQQVEGTRAFLSRRLGERWMLALFGSRSRTRTDDQEYLGTNLGTTLTENRYEATGELRLALTVKTSLVGGGEQTWYRFPNASLRDGDSTVAYGGVRTDETALISGRALVGQMWFRLDTGERERQLVWADVDETWNISYKTKLGGLYRRDLNYSAFATVGGTPTLFNETAEVYFDKILAGNVYLRLFARHIRFISDGAVVIVPPGEGLTIAERDDRVGEAGAELGYQFRSRVRMGVTATYTDRRSSIETFGIEGLLAGFTVHYNPPQPVFR